VYCESHMQQVSAVCGQTTELALWKEGVGVVKGLVVLIIHSRFSYYVCFLFTMGYNMIDKYEFHLFDMNFHVCVLAVAQFQQP
jgi:hypothetical protein